VTTSHDPTSPRAVVLISADAEWLALRSIFPDASVAASPLGEWFTAALPGQSEQFSVHFFHGGWGKIAAAASTQFVIDRWRPELLINLGTCGGFAGLVELDEIILAERTVVYDIHELMGDPDEALAHFETHIDLVWLGDSYPAPIRRTLLVSGDRDLMIDQVPALSDRFGAVAGDWESGAIAWVATRNHTRCLILRGVSDLVGATGGDAYAGNVHVWHEATERIMRTLVSQLPAWLERTNLNQPQPESLP
jgi:adenosylhomocysteine nucleosidase